MDHKYQTCRLVNQYKHVSVDKCPLAADEQECRALLKELWRDVHPEAEEEHAGHARIRTQFGHQSRTAT